VPGAVVGDRVTIRIARKAKKLLYGEIVGMDIPSPFRVTARCPHFGECGGCTMQNLRYDIQLEIKKRFLVENLRRIGGIDIKDVESFSVTSSPATYYYRNKIELSFGDQHGRVILGLRERLSPFKPYLARAIQINQCPICSHAVEKIIPFFMEFAHREGLMAFNSFTGKGILKHLILRESKSTGKIMVIFETRLDTLPAIDDLITEMTSHIPEITSIYLATNSRTDDVIQFDRMTHLFGTKSFDEEIAGLASRTYPGTFSQPNTWCAKLLYEAIGEQLNLRGSETVLGLFCGSGPIEIFLSRKAARVIGVDSNPANISAARENCTINQVTNCTFYASRAEDILKQTNIPKADVLVLDPPRTGLSKQGTALVQKLNIPRIAYVSCSPATLARDLRELCGHGYKINQIIPFDFFPHTGHLETLTILEHS
jgi:23S rRNA (uracil1939-C5)-methyltransferase